MAINKRQALARKRVGDLSDAIQKSINEICEREKFQITHAEINSALLNVLGTFNDDELRNLWK